MAKLRLTQRIQTPPGGWRYRIEALSEVAPHLVWCGPTHTFNDLRDIVHKRCAANNILPPSDEAMEDQMCQLLPPGFCVDEDGVATRNYSKFAVMSSAFKQGTRTIYNWWKNGKRRVNTDEIVRRSYICNQCPENRPIENCSACAMKGVHAIVNEIVADTTLPTDELLKSCSICQCSLKGKVRMMLDDLLPHIPQDQFKRLPQTCWLRDTEPKVGADILT